MSVFADTSALYPLLVHTDVDHTKVAEAFRRLTKGGRELISTNYVVLESVALLQRRFGLDAVRDFHRNIIPLLSIRWVGQDVHRQAMDRLQKLDRRKVSLVDCTSFIIMDSEGIRTAFTVDSDFAENGYELIPSN